jgi:hypothetical protein
MGMPEAERNAQKALIDGNPERAETLARALLSSGAGPLHIWMVLVTALRRQGRHAEALPILERIAEMAPQNYELHFDLAEMYLLLGDFERGWREYRFRYRLQHTKTLDRKVQAPRWDGQPIPGKTLLIHDEQGFGDTFQFIRLVRWAKEKSGARVVLQIVREQESFARRMKIADEVVLRGALPPPFDFHCQMMDLPMTMGLKLSNLPGKIPYLSADARRITKWRKRLAGLPYPLVCLVWAGRPEHFNDANRSLHLADYAPLAQSGATFLSVQKGPKAAEASSPPAGMKIVSLSDEINDFDDTAAIFHIADLLISIDSSPVHLAGSLGRPAWVLLPLLPDWRWLTGRDDTPWYPSHRLFRQTVRGDWSGPIEHAAAELANLK